MKEYVSDTAIKEYRKIAKTHNWDIKVDLTFPNRSSSNQQDQLESICRNYVFGLFQYIQHYSLEAKFAAFNSEPDLKFADYNYLFAIEYHCSGKLHVHGLVSGPYLRLVSQKIFKKHFYKKARGFAKKENVREWQDDLINYNLKGNKKTLSVIESNGFYKNNN